MEIGITGLGRMGAGMMTHSLVERFHSRQPESFAAKILAAMRKGFGGHAVQKAE